MQQELFDTGGKTEDKGKPRQVIITKQPKQELSKRQKEFNRLTKRLEKLRTEMVSRAASFDEHLGFYATQIYPLERKEIELRSSCVKLFFDTYQNNKQLSKIDRETVAELVAAGLDRMWELGQEEPDEEIKAIIEAIEGASYDDLQTDSFEAMKEEMQDMFDEMGFNVDLNEIRKDMSEEEIIEKMNQFKSQMDESFANGSGQQQGRKKTKKQIAEEEQRKLTEAAKTRSVSNVYKQLAKAFHPDLERDEALKSQKEELMKELTVAYESNDLHTLLKLELEWIEKEENALDRLGDEKLGIYNEVLKEQVAEMEWQVRTMTDHPRYNPLRRFDSFPFYMNERWLQMEKSVAQDTIRSLENDLARLKSKDALKHIRKLARLYREEQEDFFF